MIYFLPNLFTLLNLLSGCIAVLFVINHQLHQAVVCVIVGIVFDFFDGFVARLLNVQSELGKQLDSLADMVTSGFVPGFVMVKMLLSTTGQTFLSTTNHFQNFPLMALLGFAIALASCYRLANFNIDPNQKENFIGLPTPANTLLILAVWYMSVCKEYNYVTFLTSNTYGLLGLTGMSCYLLNAKIELFALKFKTFSFAENKFKYCFLIASATFIVFLKVAAVPLIILTYFLLSVLKNKVSKQV